MPALMKAAVPFASIALLMAISVAAGRTPAGDADIILAEGKVLTSQGVVDAIAIRDGTIVALGVEATNALRGPRTRSLSLAGASVMPGLHDLHVHPLFAGLEQFACGFAAGSNPQAITATLAKCVAEKPGGEWITGGNWVAAVFKPGQQNRAFLDAIAPNNPVLLNDEAHHSIWVNSAALRLAGITRATLDPANGVIERDADGEPTGLLRESATALVDKIVPPASLGARREALILATNQMLSYGITSFTVASIRDPDIEAFASLARDGLIKQRVRGCIVWAPPPDPGAVMGERLIATRADYTIGRFQPDCVKVFLDGVPTESHTGAMLAPYAGSAAKGTLNIAPDVLNAAVTRFDRMGLHVKFHAAGDAAVREAIDAVAAARRANGFGGPMHDVGHSTFVDPVDIARVRDVQMAWEFSPYIWYPTPIAAVDILKAVGAERMKRWLPIREAMATGALVVAGSDWSVVPSVNPWLAIETLVTRQKPGGSAENLAPDEAITREQALRVFTENGAMLMGQRDQVGAIEVGMRADLVVTRENPLTMPIANLHAIKVLMTFVDGVQVYDAAHPPKLTAR
jgi:predicted amidohydrolase YtcJ